MIDDLAQQINDGLLKPGDELPPVEELRKQYALSGVAVWEATAHLRILRLVKDVPGVGLVVE